MTARLVAHLRAAWRQQPYPLVVERDLTSATRICPAATLWTGGRAVAEHLKANGYGPGHRIGYTGPAGINWIWAMLGCLREGCVFQPLSPHWTVPTLAERLRQAPPHAVLDADGALTPFCPAAPDEAQAAAWIVWPRAGRHPHVIGAAALEALVRETDAAERTEEPPIRAVLDDGMDAESALDLLLALAAGAEVHVAPFPSFNADAPQAAPDRPVP